MLNHSVKALAEWVFPPHIHQLYHRIVKGNGYFGDYKNWRDALVDSSGYNDQLILEHILESSLKVKNGLVPYERDSVTFDKIQYSWPLLAGLLWIASHNFNRLDIVDFGGSLGSTYYQNRHFLSHLSYLRWCIVEQPQFVAIGKKCFENQSLKFHLRLEDCFSESSPHVILLSSVLPYLEKPYELLEKVISSGVPYIIIDRTPCISGEQDRLTVQRVPAEIYSASYPAWFFSKKKFISFFADLYDVVADFDALAGEIWIGNDRAQDIGMILVRKGIHETDIQRSSGHDT